MQHILKQSQSHYVLQDVRPANCCVKAYVAIWQKWLETLVQGLSLLKNFGRDKPLLFAF